MAVSFTSTIIQTNVQAVVNLFKKGKMVIPDFQRRYQYNDAKRMNLVSSLIVGLPIDFITCIEDGNVQKICDGMHRIVTLNDFLGDKFPFLYSLSKTNAKGLGVDKDLDGKYFSQFPQDLKEKIRQSPLPTALITPDVDANIPSIINSLMIAKNSSAENVPERRIALNKRFIDDPELIVPWSTFIGNIRTSVDRIVYSQAVNTSEISSTFLLVIKYLDGNAELLKSVIDRVRKLDFTGSKTKNSIVADLQGALFWSTIVECNKVNVSWDVFHNIYKYIRPMRYGETKEAHYGKRGLNILQRFNIMSVLFSNSMIKRVNRTGALKEIFGSLLIDSHIPDECKNRIESFL